LRPDQFVSCSGWAVSGACKASLTSCRRQRYSRTNEQPVPGRTAGDRRVWQRGLALLLRGQADAVHRPAVHVRGHGRPVVLLRLFTAVLPGGSQRRTTATMSSSPAPGRSPGRTTVLPRAAPVPGRRLPGCCWAPGCWPPDRTTRTQTGGHARPRRQAHPVAHALGRRVALSGGAPVAALAAAAPYVRSHRPAGGQPPGASISTAPRPHPTSSTCSSPRRPSSSSNCAQIARLPGPVEYS
jgi:hypothetical protein